MFKEDTLVEVVEKGPEIMVYFMINEIGGFTWRMNHDMADGRIPHADCEKATHQQVRLVECLPRFGVEQPFKAGTKAGSEAYWKWFRWWDGWYKDLSGEAWEAMQPDISMEMTDEQIAKHRPSGDWRSAEE